MRRHFLALAATLIAVTMVTTTTQAVDISRLGHRWDVTVPGGWSGVWTRRDYRGVITSLYDAAWYHPSYGSIRSEVKIHLDVRDGLIIERQDLNGPYPGGKCWFTGRLEYAQRAAYGTFKCHWAPGPFSWSARISR